MLPLRSIALLLISVSFCATANAQKSATGGQAAYSASQLEKRCETAFARYERFQSSGRLKEKDTSRGFVCVTIVDELRKELSRTLFAYNKALGKGFKADGAELKQVRAAIEKIQGRLDKCGYWTCFRRDEPFLSNPVQNKLDVIRSQAWVAALRAGIGEVDEAVKRFDHVQTLIKEFGRDIESSLDAGGKPVDYRKHPAYARTIAEVERFKKQAESQIGAVQTNRDQLIAAIKDLDAAATQCTEFLRKVSNVQSLSGAEDNIVSGIEAFKGELDAFEGSGAVTLRDSLKSFGDKYGTGSASIGQSVSKIMNGKRLTGLRMPGGLYDRAASDLEKIESVRKSLCAKLIDIARSNAATKAVDATRREASFAMAKRCVQLALAFSPQNEEAKTLQGELGGKAGAAKSAIDKALDAGTWEAHFASFQGPGDPSSLAQSALDWLAGDPGWTKDKTPVSVRINGDWVVAERARITKETLTWGLPIEAAFIRHGDRDAGRDVAWVYRLTIVTNGITQSAPWKMARVGSNRQMRASNVTGVGSSSGPNFLFKLLLVLALLGSGILLAGPALAKRVAAITPLLEILKPLRPMIGVASLAIGAVLLLFNLLSPFSDLLPQAAAMLAGLFLGLELLLKKTAKLAPTDAGDNPSDNLKDNLKDKANRNVDAAVEKTQEFLASQEEKIRSIEKFQVPLGATCLVLGLLHLLASGSIFL